MIKYYITSIKDIDDFEELAKEHWNSFNNKPPKFNLDVLKQFNVVQAKDGEKTIGYILYILFNSPYYNEIWCQIDMFYLKTSYRKQGIGTKMFKIVEEEANKNGASKLLSSFNIKQPLDIFYKSLGYTQTHIAVAKEI